MDCFQNLHMLVYTTKRRQQNFSSKCLSLIPAALKVALHKLHSSLCWTGDLGLINVRIYRRPVLNLSTLWEPYHIFVPGFRIVAPPPIALESCSKGSNGSASLPVCTLKKFFGWELQIFWEWCHKWSSFGAILAHVTWPRAQPLDQSVSLKHLLQTRLESESFEPLIDFLAFLGQKLWSKINKLINYLTS